MIRFESTMGNSHKNRLTAHFGVGNVGQRGQPSQDAMPEAPPANSHYANLGIPLLECNSITIRSAARKRLRQLEVLQRNGYDERVLSHYRQQVLAAAATLLDPVKRLAYEATLPYIACPECGRPNESQRSVGNADAFSCKACGCIISRRTGRSSSSQTITRSSSRRFKRGLRIGRGTLAVTITGRLLKSLVVLAIAIVPVGFLAVAGISMIQSLATAFIVGILFATVIAGYIATKVYIATKTVGTRWSTMVKAISHSLGATAFDDKADADAIDSVLQSRRGGRAQSNHKISDIPPADARNSYSLLGLRPFEDDPTAIERAVVHTLSLLSQEEALATRRDCDQLVAEVHQAAATLLDGDEKDAYDDKLRLATHGGEYGFSDLVRIHIRRAQQELRLQPSVFCFLVPLAAFGLFAILTFAITLNFLNALLVGALAASLAAFVTFRAYLTPNPDATEPLDTSMTALRRAMSFAVTSIACSAVVLLTGKALSAPKSFFVCIAALVASICATAYFAFRSSSRYTNTAIDRLQRRNQPTVFNGRIDGSYSPEGSAGFDGPVQPLSHCWFEAESEDLPNSEELPWGIPIEEESFNPYYQWLGIPFDAQPADFYRLIGVDLFESNPDVIESLCDQRLAYLKNMSMGKYGHLAQQLMNELTRARLVLLSPQKKSEYDAKLREAIEDAAKLDDGSDKSVAANEPMMGIAIYTGRSERRGRSRVQRNSRRRRRRKASGRSLVVQAVLGGVVGLTIGWFILAKWVDSTWDPWGIVWPLSVNAPSNQQATVDVECTIPIFVDNWDRAWKDRIEIEFNKGSTVGRPRFQIKEDKPVVVWKPTKADRGRQTMTFTIFNKDNPNIFQRVTLDVFVAGK